MPIISSIGRKQVKARFLLASIYALLTLGSLTMLYPFILMLAGTTKTGVDMNDQNLIPQFLIDDTALYRKHIEALFNERVDALKIAYNVDAGVEALNPPAEVNEALVEQWFDFLDQADLPLYTWSLGHLCVQLSRNSFPYERRLFCRQLSDEFHGSIEEMNQKLETTFYNWTAFDLLPDQFVIRQETVPASVFYTRYEQFKRDQPLAYRNYFSIEGFYKVLYLKSQYTRDIGEYNKSHGTNYANYTDIHLPRRYPADAPEKVRSDWEDFVRNSLNLFWIRLDNAALPHYQRFLRSKYNDIATLNTRYAARYASFDQIPLVSEPTAGGLILSDWSTFITGWKDPDTKEFIIAPKESLIVYSVDFLFRDHLMAKFGSLDKINAALGTGYKDLLDIQLPQQQAHYTLFLHMRGFLKWEFIRRNFISVSDYILLHGRGIFNTAAYCFLAVLSALIVNPLAAYALSRYQIPSAYKVLLFLMLTMAFPPMVTQIPNFLLLRELNLLNTFWALILPSLANGYSIFLLKGFFDSLPRELYESASLDGAGEWTMFWQLTMNLSKPILAVIALSAFTGAYANFMFALLICQDRDMWTLMVWLYQLQRTSGPGVIYASLVMAAVPTFLVFAFCQNIIMRGIVVPVEK
ncbi:MAG: carbohydrate ABC transporter permease [Phycisphaeraceae bacterium]|nr:carbohydrate ABC transporter permease [Phycisphaeraceae bacterium]